MGITHRIVLMLALAGVLAACGQDTDNTTKQDTRDSRDTAPARADAGDGLLRRRAEAGGVGNVCAVVSGTVGAVDLVGHVKAVHDLRRANRARNFCWGCTRAHHPCAEQHLAQTIKMIGVEVR